MSREMNIWLTLSTQTTDLSTNEREEKDKESVKKKAIWVRNKTPESKRKIRVSSAMLIDVCDSLIAHASSDIFSLLCIFSSKDTKQLDTCPI
jgi:hypothetical protein